MLIGHRVAALPLCRVAGASVPEPLRQLDWSCKIMHLRTHFDLNFAMEVRNSAVFCYDFLDSLVF